LGIYPEEYKSGYNKGACIPMFIAALAELQKQPRYHTTDKRIKEMWHLYKMEFYSATKKNEILLFAGKWMEVSQVQKAKSHIFSLYMWDIDLIQIQAIL
jgi:hypothetical protein